MGYINPAILAQIAAAKPSEGGNILRDGKYVIILRNMKIEEKFGGICFISEFRIKTAEASVDGVVPNAVGSTASLVVNMSNKENFSAMGNVKSYVCALLGYKEPGPEQGAEKVAAFQKEFAETLGFLCNDNQPSEGMLLRCETYRKARKKDGKGGKAGDPLTLYNWYRVEQTAADIVASKAALRAMDAAAPPVTA